MKTFVKNIAAKMLVAAGLSLAAFTTVEAKPVTNFKAIQNLAQQFKGAKDVTWKEGTDYLKASFKLNNQDVDVFYNTDGDYLATGKTIDVQSLPLKAYQAITDKYQDFKVDSAIEYYDADDNLSYYVSLRKDNSTIILHITTSGDVSVFKKG